MKKYRVTYEIDVDAESPLDAALQVEKIMVDMRYRPAFTVTEYAYPEVAEYAYPEVAEFIDLEEEYGH